MEKNNFYNLKHFIKGISFYYDYIKTCYPAFFSINKEIAPFPPIEILNIITHCNSIDSAKTKVYSHQFFHDAIEGISFYKQKLKSKMSTSIAETTSDIAYFHIINLANQALYILLKYHKENLEDKLESQNIAQSQKILLKEKQSIKYEETYPKQFKSEYTKYINERLSDFQEIQGTENNSYNPEIKKILEGVSKSLEVNINGKDLLSSLVEKRYEEFTTKLKDILLIPSAYDIYDKDKERMFHVYLLGILEGRMILYKTTSNQESGLGRYDICLSPINPINPGVIIEIKKNDDKEITPHLDEAMNQIKDKLYTYSLEKDGVNEILLISLVFKGRKPYTKYEIIKK